MTPYRASSEPEPEVLWSTPLARFVRRRSAILASTIGATLGGSVLGLSLGAPLLGGAFFAAFLGAATVAAQREWRFGRRLEARIEQIGATHRLRVTTTSLVLNAPLTTTGASRMDEGGHLVLRLVVRGANDAAVTFGAIADSSDTAPTRDDWFDGALLPPDVEPGELMIDPPAKLMELRDFISSLD